jgi:transcriptional regulator with XRE-family HTH domain
VLNYEEEILKSNEEIMTRLRIARDIKGFTQEYIGALIDMSGTNYSKIERGELALTLPDLLVVAKTLGVKPKELFEEKAVKPETAEEMPAYEGMTQHQLDQWEASMIRKIGWLLDERFRQFNQDNNPQK